MAKIGVNIKINVSEIDKARLFKGTKGVYLDATVFIDVDEADAYGNNGMITQDVSKEEKANGVMGNILGNCKVFWRDAVASINRPSPVLNKGGTPNAQSGAHLGGVDEDFDDDVPF